MKMIDLSDYFLGSLRVKIRVYAKELNLPINVILRLFALLNPMCSPIHLLSVDPSLGRVDYSALSDQTLIELLIDGFDDVTKEKYQDNEGTYLNVCEWPRVKCDAYERVIKIHIDSSDVRCSLQLGYVPPKVKKLNISPSYTKSSLTGRVDLTQLPEGMQKLYLYHNQLSGEIDLTQLPKGMVYFTINSNQLTGEIDLTQLPDGIGYLYLHRNEFTGEVDLTHLPHGMECLSIHTNQLMGSTRHYEVTSENESNRCASKPV